MTAPTTASGNAGTELLRGVAHLLRTPLGVILGMTATLRDYDARFTSEQRVTYLGEVLQAADEMRVALDGISLLARLIAGTLSFAPSATSLAELVRAGDEALRPVWTGAAGFAAEAPPVGNAAADAQRVGQALAALAQVFTPAAGARLSGAGGPPPFLRLGPLMPRARDDLDAMLRTPLDAAVSAEWIARPGGWPVLVARHLFEAQGAALALEPAESGVTLRVDLPPAAG